MKRIINAVILLCLCVGLFGCGGKNESNFPWTEKLNTRLTMLGVDDVESIKSNGYKKGDTESMIEVTTKKEKINVAASSYQDVWDFSRIVNDDLKTYYVSSLYEGMYDIYDYKSGEVIKYKAEEAKKEETEEKEPTPVSKSAQFIKNGYKEYTGNYRKDRTMSDGSIMHVLFNISEGYYDVSDDTGISMSYFWNGNWAGYDVCKYDFSTASPKNSSKCSSDAVQSLSSLKDAFEKEMKILELTIDDLNK